MSVEVSSGSGLTKKLIKVKRGALIDKIIGVVDSRFCSLFYLFMFQLTKEEFEFLKQTLIFQNGISSWGGTRKLPYAFTEQGLAMLSGVLNSDIAIAIDVNISIMRAFVAIRRMAAALPKPDVTADVAQLRKDFEELKLDIEDILHDQNEINESTRIQFDAISTALAELQSKESKPRKKIGFIQEKE